MRSLADSSPQRLACSPNTGLGRSGIAETQFRIQSPVERTRYQCAARHRYDTGTSLSYPLSRPHLPEAFTLRQTRRSLVFSPPQQGNEYQRGGEHDQAVGRRRHDGEAAASAATYWGLSAADRAALVRFLESL